MFDGMKSKNRIKKKRTLPVFLIDYSVLQQRVDYIW